MIFALETEWMPVPRCRLHVGLNKSMQEFAVLSLYFTLHYNTMALLHSTLLYITLPWLYFTHLYSTPMLIDTFCTPSTVAIM